MKDKIKIFTTFSGYDSQMLALRQVCPDADLIGWSEIDRHAITAHNVLFPEYADRNYGDITKIDWNAVPDFDLLTYSSPCQDFSIAGLQQGGEKGSGTRSSLLWEVEKAIATKRPKWLLMKNVPSLTHKTFMPLLRRWFDTLTRYGYTNYAKCLNAKDYGVPQNRLRLFVVSTLGREPYFFPKKRPNTRPLAELLDPEVGSGYFLKQRVIQRYLEHNDRHRERGNGFKFEPISGKGIAHTLTLLPSRADMNFVFANELKQLANLVPEKGFKNPQRGRVYSVQGIAPCNCAHGNDTLAKFYTEQGVRCLTERECYRLMDVSESDIDKLLAEKAIPKTAQYKLAGNSIVVAVLADIFRKMFVNRESETQQRELF